jgi:hypothetical protein
MNDRREDKKPYRINDPHDRIVRSVSGKAEVVWEPEGPKVLGMQPCDYDAIFGSRLGQTED